MKRQIKITVVVLALWILAAHVYHFFQGPIESSIGVNQLEDNAVTFSASMQIAQGTIQGYIAAVALIVLAVVWIAPLVHHKKEI